MVIVENCCPEMEELTVKNVISDQ